MRPQRKPTSIRREPPTKRSATKTGGRKKGEPDLTIFLKFSAVQELAEKIEAQEKAGSARNYLIHCGAVGKPVWSSMVMRWWKQMWLEDWPGAMEDPALSKSLGKDWFMRKNRSRPPGKRRQNPKTRGDSHNSNEKDG